MRAPSASASSARRPNAHAGPSTAGRHTNSNAPVPSMPESSQPMLSPSQPPLLTGPVPGPRSAALAARLTGVESRNVTFISHDFPVFWRTALGSNVWDADGNRFVDLTAAFGVAAAGHRHPVIEDAIRSQSETLVHAMGDVHPSEVRVELVERLAALGPPGSRVVLGTSGSEASRRRPSTPAGPAGWPSRGRTTASRTEPSRSPIARCFASRSARSSTPTSFVHPIPPKALAMHLRLSIRWGGFSRSLKVGSEP
jgi:hypothetical protein